MTIARDSESGIEVVIPYGNPSAALHLRLSRDYVTFCGRNCKGWTLADTKFVEAIDSAFTCKRCKKASFT